MCSDSMWHHEGIHRDAHTMGNTALGDPGGPNRTLILYVKNNVIKTHASIGYARREYVWAICVSLSGT